MLLPSIHPQRCPFLELVRLQRKPKSSCSHQVFMFSPKTSFTVAVFSHLRVFTFHGQSFHLSRLKFSCSRSLFSRFTFDVFTFDMAISGADFWPFTFEVFTWHVLSFHLTQFLFSLLTFVVFTQQVKFTANMWNSLWMWKPWLARTWKLWISLKSAKLLRDKNSMVRSTCAMQITCSS